MNFYCIAVLLLHFKTHLLITTFIMLYVLFVCLSFILTTIWLLIFHAIIYDYWTGLFYVYIYVE